MVSVSVGLVQIVSGRKYITLVSFSCPLVTLVNKFCDYSCFILDIFQRTEFESPRLRLSRIVLDQQNVTLVSLLCHHVTFVNQFVMKS